MARVAASVAWRSPQLEAVSLGDAGRPYPRTDHRGSRQCGCRGTRRPAAATSVRRYEGAPGWPPVIGCPTVKMDRFTLTFPPMHRFKVDTTSCRFHRQIQYGDVARGGSCRSLRSLRGLDIAASSILVEPAPLAANPASWPAGFAASPIPLVSGLLQLDRAQPRGGLRLRPRGPPRSVEARR